MARRQRKQSRSSQASPSPPGPAPKRDRMARVQVADDVWTDFRALAGNDSIATVLGRLVEREVDRYRSRRLKAGQLDDTELVDTLERAHQLHDQLAAIVERLEQRLDHQHAPRDLGP
jgi:predicted CopG family antitoxin